MVGGSCRLVEREPAVSSVTRRAEKFDFYQIHGACVLIESGLAPRLIGPQPRSALVAPDIPIPRTPCPGPRVTAASAAVIRHPVLRWMGATLDGRIEGSDSVFESKFMLPWSFSEEAAAEKYMPQLQHNMW